MGACLSCLYPRRDKSLTGETQPLLDDSSVAQDPDSGDANTRNQKDLSRIVQSTHDHFIDITTLGQPDFEHQDGGVSETLLQSIRNVDPSKVWSWPKLRPLTEEESEVLNHYIPETVERTSVKL